MASYEWHGGPGIQKLLLEFHMGCARYPEEALKPAKADLEGIKYELLDTLQDDVCTRFEYVGSTYEHLDPSVNDISFDIMVVLQNGQDLQSSECEPRGPGYRLLKLKPGTEARWERWYYSCLYGGGLYTESVERKFKGSLQEAINKAGLQWRVKLDDFQLRMNVYKNDRSEGGHWYSVRMIPTYHVAGEYLVAASNECLIEFDAWQVSYSLEEKKKLAKIDKLYFCSKQCIRILKVLRRHQAGLQRLDSHLIKTVVFHRCNEWKQTEMPLHFFDLLRALANYLDQGHLPHYYEHSINLLRGFSADDLANMASCLKKLCGDETQFSSLLRDVMGPTPERRYKLVPDPSQQDYSDQRSPLPLCHCPPLPLNGRVNEGSDNDEPSLTPYEKAGLCAVGVGVAVVLVAHIVKTVKACNRRTYVLQ